MMDAAHAELLLKGAAQAAPDVPAMGIHARPAAMNKKGYMVDLRSASTGEEMETRGQH
eukprot:COSAG01_NODE_46514_length_399_cov_1.560000_2_plen_58_part_00